MSTISNLIGFAIILKKRDPEFNRKMREVLMVYQDVSLFPIGATDDKRPTPIYSVSVDEKPGGAGYRSDGA